MEAGQWFVPIRKSPVDASDQRGSFALDVCRESPAAAALFSITSLANW
ncbi:MAG: hypothetical protein KXJ50_06180 [Vulcanococcus sp.]|jgi:hypothetical protein|nr:hypothetical protein [Vulcanococcus sp.]MBW0180637.1 hypothetical protein [Vulcanococcus sp.]